MTVQQIYQRFQTPSNLQEHMLRVASLAQVLLEHWSGNTLGTQAIVQACVFHDIAKPMNFNLEKQAQFGMSKADIAQLATLQEHLRANYGSDEHQAVVRICQEIGCTPKAIELVDNLEWENTARLLAQGNLEALVPIYCDMRISPRGIMPLIERINELKNREHDANDMNELAETGRKLEKMQQDKVTINLNKITDEQINERLQPLRELEI